MAIYRGGVDTSAGPSRGSVLGHRGQLLVRVRLFDSGAVDHLDRPADGEDVFTDLRPEDARRLAARLIEHAALAEEITEQAGWWQR
jgi:hypothetical protein